MNKPKKLPAVFTAFFILFALRLACAQSAQLEEMRKQYPDEKAVYLKKSKKIVITLLDNQQLKITAHHYAEMLHLQQMSNIYADESIPFSKFNEITSINAHTLVPDKNKYRDVKVEEFVTRNVVSSGIFFDDYKEKTFVFPGIMPGAKTVLEYSEELKEPRVLGAYYFNSYVPVIESELIIVAPESVKINFKIFGDRGIRSEITKNKKGDEITYSWKGRELEKFTAEENAYRGSYTEPHIVPYITEIKTKTASQRMLTDVSDLYKWYYSLVKESGRKECPPLRTLVDTLTRGLTSPHEKTKAIFYWVQDHIKYIAFEDGLGGLIPRAPEKVYEKRYGDCKDMANMLTTMLNMANVPAHIAWIGTRSIPYTYQEVPTPLVDNHMIATVRIDGKDYFLDATGSYHRFDLPTSMIQGKQALISLDADKYELVTVPVVEASQNMLSDTCRFTLKQNLVVGKGKAVLRGFQKADATYSLIGKTEKDRKTAVSSILRKGHNKFFIDKISYTNMENKEKDLLLDYDFRLEDYAKTINDEVYINLHLERRYQNEHIEVQSRKSDIENEYRFTDSYTSVFEIPEGYKLNYLPGNNEFKHELFGFTVNYQQQGNRVIMTRHLYINYLVLKKADFVAWNNMVKALNKAYRETVTLKR